ncbi:cytochrome P450 [Flagelloscypha sp. PMI_526]|nr:cytochrome P450 [Flagelloscypha sp. PMI_526]
MIRTMDALAASAFVGVLVLWFRSKARRAVNLPPGPKPVPVLGNIRDLTPHELWLSATRWAKQYGDVVYLHVLGQGLVFLNSREACFDLMDGKGNIYSDKPKLVMLNDLCGCGDYGKSVAFTGNGDTARRQRKHMNKAFGPGAIPAYNPMVVEATDEFLRSLLAAPETLDRLSRRFIGGLTLQLVYGYKAQLQADPFLNQSEECVEILANDIVGGAGLWPVDLIPALQRLPDWMPGAGFKAKARAWKATMEDWVDRPYQFTKGAVRSGEYDPSFCSTIIEDKGEKITEQEEHDLKWTANSMYGSSMDTTVTAMQHFLLAMMHKAQLEIDTVLHWELLRWGSFVPLGLPHRLQEDDIYRGMVIPKGTLVYPSPDVEKRHLDPRQFVFGFGRRVCPGQHLVDSSLWILIARMLATFNIQKPLD